MAALYKNFHDVYEVTHLTPGLPSDPAHWWRLVTALFAYGKDQFMPCLMALGLIWGWGGRIEKAVGAGGALFTFLVGGALANVVRCLAESEGWLTTAGSGGIVGGAALVGASVSGVVRTREGTLGRTLATGIGSLALSVLFSAQSLAKGFGEDLLRFLPSVLAGFVIGGFLGALLPLRSSERARAGRAALLAVSFVILTISGFFYERALYPSRGTAESRPKAPSGPAVAEQDDATLGLVYDVPLFMSHVGLANTGKERASGYRPTFRSLPTLILRVLPKGEYYAPDTTALELARQERDQDPTAKHLAEGPLECSLGPAYFQALVVSSGRGDGGETAIFHAIVAPKALPSLIHIRLESEPDDEEARPTLEAVVRSLKLRPGHADK
jgi:hypothetical protein